MAKKKKKKRKTQKMPKAPKWMWFYWKRYKRVRGSSTKSKIKATKQADKIRDKGTPAKAYNYKDKWYSVYERRKVYN